MHPQIFTDLMNCFIVALVKRNEAQFYNLLNVSLVYYFYKIKFQILTDVIHQFWRLRKKNHPNLFLNKQCVIIEIVMTVIIWFAIL